RAAARDRGAVWSVRHEQLGRDHRRDERLPLGTDGRNYPHREGRLMLIRAQSRDLGGFTVDRVLPSMARRMVGPWIFFDHFGPANAKLDVRPHPHINLATVTYLFEGRVHHRDSLGSDAIIEPGTIHWMTAGRGIAHSERGDRQDLHGLQLWVALPREHEED